MVQCNNWKTKINLQKYACNWLFNAIAKEIRNCSSSQLQMRLEIVFNEFEKEIGDVWFNANYKTDWEFLFKVQRLHCKRHLKL